jgi:hypothetical protein
MDRSQLEKLSPLFNGQSDKVVSFAEYECKEKYLLQENLTLAEKAIFIIDDIRAAFKLATSKKLDAFTSQYVDPAMPEMASYISAKEIAETEFSVCEEGMNKRLQEKILKLRLRALQECADYSSYVKTGELKPL